MARCDGGYPYCQDCVNQDIDEDECDACDDGSNYEPFEEDDSTWSIFDLKKIMFAEAA